MAVRATIFPKLRGAIMRAFSVEQCRDHAVACLQQGDCRGAFKYLAVALSLAPDDGRCRELMGITHWEAGSPVEAVCHLERATLLTPLSPVGQLALALGYEVSGRRELSRDMLIALAGRAVLPLEVFEPLARALGRNGEPLLALETCRRASQADPGSTGPLLGAVFYMNQLGAPSQQTLSVLFRAHHLDPDDLSIRTLLARRLHDSGLSGEAAELLAVVDFSRVGCRSCLAAICEILLAAGDHERAAHCQKIVDSLLHVERSIR
jgi:Flp pilus assembly protein TadD